MKLLLFSKMSSPQLIASPIYIYDDNIEMSQKKRKNISPCEKESDAVHTVYLRKWHDIWQNNNAIDILTMKIACLNKVQ